MNKLQISDEIKMAVQEAMREDKRKRLKRNLILFLGLAIFLPATIWAAAIVIPNRFSDGDTLSAGKLNDNFDSLGSGLNALDPTNWSSSTSGVITYSGKIIVKGEQTTVDSSGNNRLWGQGRPNAVRYGTTGIEAGLCSNGSFRFGLSRGYTSWAGAASQCGKNTWVCTETERGAAVCDTTRPDSAVDAVFCNNTANDRPSNNHEGYIADVDSSSTRYIKGVNEQGVLVAGAEDCELRPVWCCSE